MLISHMAQDKSRTIHTVPLSVCFPNVPIFYLFAWRNFSMEKCVWFIKSGWHRILRKMNFNLYAKMMQYCSFFHWWIAKLKKSSNARSIMINDDLEIKLFFWKVHKSKLIACCCWCCCCWWRKINKG